MKLPTKTISLLASAAIFTLTSLSAVETDPVGYVSTTLSEGYNAIGVTFTKASVFSGAVTASTASTLTLSDAPTNLDFVNNSYYVEVIDNADDWETGDPSFIGDRIDISSVSGSVLTLDFTVEHNTLTTAVNIPATANVTVRPHYTIGDFAELVADDVNTDDQFDAAKSDQILLYVEGLGFRTHINYLDEWYENFGDFEVATNKIIAPGSGFFFLRNSAAGTPDPISVVFTGTVRMNNYVQRLRPGYQFVANGYPSEASPVDYSYDEVLQASTNFDASESDLILTWDGSLKTHLLYDDGAGNKNWYQNFGDFNQVDSTDLLSASSAMFVFIKDTGHILEIVRPF